MLREKKPTQTNKTTHYLDQQKMVFVTAFQHVTMGQAKKKKKK